MTYSIVAFDRASGELGVAVQSHYLAVGAAVPWATPGVGAVATQATVNISYGPRALELLRAGCDAQAALSRLIAADEGGASRQLAIVDAAGNAAVHTGGSCIREAGHVARNGVSCQGNILATDRVWPAMLEAFESASGSLHHRLLAALDAAEAEGGDLRGRQSAAILVVPATGELWETTVSVRVDDHPEPLLELRRLVTLRDAYKVATEADRLLDAGDRAEAALLFGRACELAPHSHELLFWVGVSFAQMGDLDAGVQRVRRAIDMQPNWMKMLDRLPAELAPVGAALIARLNSE
jgi:uncharacterized Ntn-hydrolase superfamily protein